MKRVGCSGERTSRAWPTAIPTIAMATALGPDGFRDSDVDSYTWAKTKPLNASALYKTLACYTYQSCEHPGWADSEAQALTARLIPERAKLESWRGAALDNEATPWGW